MEEFAKKEVIRELKEKLLAMQGFKRRVMDHDTDFGLKAMASAFPCGILPMGAVHEFISPTAACSTATNGFISGLLSYLMADHRSCVWISTQRSLFPVGLTYFGIEPHRIIFIDVKKDKDALWVMEQALKCNALAAVVMELNGEVSFAQSRRLQLAVEESQVTGFLHRKKPRRENTLACVSRWMIKPTTSRIDDGLPGVGLPIWEVRLDKIRNGKPGTWYFSWQNGTFISIQPNMKIITAATQQEHYA